MATRMQQRRGTASEWTSANPVLSAGEVGYVTDTRVMKVGNGVTPWNDLPNVLAGTYATETQLNDHAIDTTNVHGIADTALLVGSSNIDSIVVLTQAAYDALTPDARTLYVIEG